MKKGLSEKTRPSIETIEPFFNSSLVTLTCSGTSETSPVERALPESCCGGGAGGAGGDAPWEGDDIERG